MRARRREKVRALVPNKPRLSGLFLVIGPVGPVAPLANRREFCRNSPTLRGFGAQPVAPVAPVAPVGPVGPIGPVLPVPPVLPCEPALELGVCGTGPTGSTGQLGPFGRSQRVCGLQDHHSKTPKTRDSCPWKSCEHSRNEAKPCRRRPDHAH